MVFKHADSAVQRFEQQVTGIVLVPEDVGYEDRRRGWDLTVDHRPAIILAARSTADVVAGIHFAREANLGVAMKCTGHGTLYAADADSIMIETSQMANVSVDAERQCAQVEAGAVWQGVLDRSVPLGLAPLLGSSPAVGVVGYMLGGGIGWLSRRYGLGADSVHWIDIVTPDGILRRASPTEHGELFWGLRGGGGCLGAVVAMEFELYPVATIYGGNLIYPPDLARDGLRFYRDWIETVPDELTSSFAILKYPPLPQVPEAVRGKTLIALWAAYAGDSRDGEMHIRRWLDWQMPITNSFRQMPFSEIGSIANDPTAPTAFLGSSDMFAEIRDDAIDVIVRYATDDTSPMVSNILRHAGGAIGRVPATANAVCNRDAKLYFLTGGLAPTPEALEAAKTYSQRYRAALRPYLHGGLWMNFMNGNGEGASKRIRDAYSPEAYDRLLDLKKTYDPANRFRFSHPLRA